MRTRKLVLKTERLADLTPTELGEVAGGNTNLCPSYGCAYSWYVTCRIRTLLDCPPIG